MKLRRLVRLNVGRSGVTVTSDQVSLKTSVDFDRSNASLPYLDQTVGIFCHSGCLMPTWQHIFS